jgi:hypothetical protein
MYSSIVIAPSTPPAGVGFQTPDAAGVLHPPPGGGASDVAGASHSGTRSGDCGAMGLSFRPFVAAGHRDGTESGYMEYPESAIHRILG